jgi:hypothetical protein
VSKVENFSDIMPKMHTEKFSSKLILYVKCLYMYTLNFELVQHWTSISGLSPTNFHNANFSCSVQETLVDRLNPEAEI